MSVTVRVRQLDRPLAVAPGQTILDAALAAGLDYPCGCTSGNCGACKSVLLSGEVEMLEYSEFALSEEERDAGYVLACRAQPKGPCEVAWVEADDVAMHPRRDLVCRVIELRDATHDIRVLRLAVESGGPLAFSAGQYAHLVFDRQPGRDYSMANRPDDPVLEFHVRLVPGGAVTPYVKDRLALGDQVKVKGPFGTSYWREAHKGPILALAGGSGLAPIKSIVDSALKSGRGQSLMLYFGVREERDLYLEDHFRALAKAHSNFKFVPVLSQPGAPTARRTGNLADVVAADLGAADLAGAKSYLAGPPIMVESAVKALTAKGLKRTDCHADAFYTQADRR
ncbi:MAG: 2Fe-2S iron-sulfur cluster binding domain-containing protein [Alphaproteobacteria bacterium]|nr:2Fe-2S iron-sulfur cluster binding domain-containing protein [Alphaproteobacteria bacterium]